MLSLLLACRRRLVRQRRWSQGFRSRSPGRVLRHKEWTLLARDPWLMSQSLMQVLYLLPPALLLWRSFRDGTGALVVLVPVLVMAAGQLAGGLAWLSISGEDAPDLVATAPIPARRIVRAKIEAVMGSVALIFAPLIAALAFASPRAAMVAVLGVAHCRGLSHLRSALLPGAGQAQPVPPPASVVAHRDVRRSLFIDCLGRSGGAGGGRFMAGVVSGGGGARRSGRRAID